MAINIDRQSGIALGRETTYGTKSTLKMNMGVLGFGVSFPEGHILNDQGFANQGTVHSAKKGGQHAEFAISGVVDAGWIGMFLYGMFGTLTPSADDPEAGADTHTFSWLDSCQKPSYSLWRKDDNTDEVYVGCRLSTLTFTFVTQDRVTFTANFIGKTPTVETETTTYTESDWFTGSQVMTRLTTVGGSFTGDGIPLTDLTLNFNANASAHYVMDSTNTLNNVLTANFQADGNFGLLYESETYRDLYLNNTTQALEIAITGNTNIGATSTPYSLTLTVNQANFMFEEGRELNSFNSQNIPFVAEKETLITAVLINGTDSALY